MRLVSRWSELVSIALGGLVGFGFAGFVLSVEHGKFWAAALFGVGTVVVALAAMVVG